MAGMTKDKRIVIRIDRCMGCHTCEVACALAHSESGDLNKMVARGERPGYRVNVESYGGKAVPLHCQHCEQPACVMACPTGAVHRAGEGGPVLYDEERCIGCRMCVQACPFGVITVSPDGKRVLKCDLCIERLARHEEPACVSACPTRALLFVDTSEPARDKRRKLAGQMVAAQDQDEAPRNETQEA